jgi:hypothetical protein
MPLSWNEIRKRAIEFSQEFADATRENAETQSFYNAFFDVFGISRRRVASFEEPVKKLGDKRGRIDLFWKGLLLIEQKSGGRDLGAAYTQALDYFPNLKEEELPRYILVSDFQRFELYDLETNAAQKFSLSELHKNVELFGFIAGYQKREFRDQDPVNIEASERMGKLHDMLKQAGYVGHDLELLLVRLLFCLFAEDTAIFERSIFQFYLEEKTKEDGSDLGLHLAMLFQTLNTAEEKRQISLDEALRAFPYINGNLFADTIPIPAFDSDMRESLISACYFDWSRISPAIFGSLFQSVMDKDKRRGIGAHYTTEKNIMKILKPLFLDDLHAEFEKIKRDKKKLKIFQEKLSKLTFLDPACGCGNFLILAYRELRELEIGVIKALYGDDQQVLDVSHLSRVDVDAFYGIEVEEFSAKIAEVAMWLMDHQMNIRLSEAFGVYYVRLPLKKSAHIRHANALELDWKDVVAPENLCYILGNPPFIGHQYRNDAQQADMKRVWGAKGQVNRLDYVTCWFKKALDFTRLNPRIETAFVSTNSITQGEQAGILWPVLFEGGMNIRFAHRTFQWNSEARSKAAVHCVIVGLSTQITSQKLIYEYDHVRGDPHVATVSNINGYLIDGPQYAVPARTQPQAGLLKMHKGSQPTDGARLKKPEGGYDTFSNLILDEPDRIALLAADPNSEKWLRPFVGGDELISGTWRWCLWLKDADPSELRASRPIAERLERVRAGRLKSPTPSVRAYANFPTLFTQDRQPSDSYLAIPEVSSEAREYIPIAMLPPSVIASNKLQIITGANILYFGILTSAMHMAWMRTVAGRLESRYSYAPAVYNSFPWPQLNEAKIKLISDLAEIVIDTRASFTGSNLDDLYDIDAMPPQLKRAHQALDKAVDAAYRKTPFNSERERIEYLFSLYQQLTAPLVAAAKPKRQSRRKVVV